MRHTTLACLSIFASLALLPVGTVHAADETVRLPERRAGLWELKTGMDEGSGVQMTSMKMCIDAGMEANTVIASAEEHRKSCEKYDIARSPERIVVDAVCTFNGRHVTSRTEMSGDFQSAFKVHIDSATSDAKAGVNQSVVVKRTITQEGTYLAPSCGELKGGEAMGPDGMKVAVQ
ncbi:MAG: DUF3617 domain-containing protein [Hyphomicrobium sp.]